jgi:hypothetical protein
MTDIERKTLALVNEVLDDMGYAPMDNFLRGTGFVNETLCRIIEQHEAFKQEVSDAVTALLDRFLGDGLSQGVINGHLHQFIIPAPKPDPLVEVLKESDEEFAPEWDYAPQAKAIRAALEARGLEIRSKSDEG